MAQVSSYNVANRSGAQVRSDINDIYSAIKTCNSGPNDPANPEKFMLFGDSTTGDNNLKIYDGSNFRPIGKVTEDNLGLVKRDGDTLEGVLELHNTADANSPVLTFNGNTDTGIYRPAANSIGFSTGGTEKFRMDANGLSIYADGNATKNIYFNDLNNSNFVAVRGPTTVNTNFHLTLPSSITNGGFLQTDANGQLSFQIVNGVPTGAVFALPDTQAGGNAGYQSNGIPTGYLQCNGQLISRQTYAALYEVIGTRYGNTDQNNFRVPDLRGEFIRGWDDARGVDQNREIGSYQGGSNAFHNHSASSSSHVSDNGHSHFSFRGDRVGVNRNHHGLTTTNFPAAEIGPSINEGYNIQGSGNVANVGNTNTVATGISVSTTTAIGTDGSEARPRNIAMIYIIKI